MTVYCAHAAKVFHKQSNLFVCPQCRHDWYTKDPIPMVVIGFTSEEEVKLENKYQKRYSLTRCPVCHDILTTDHLLCTLKGQIKKLFLWLGKLSPRNHE